MEIPELEYMSVNEFEKSNITATTWCPILEERIYTIGDGEETKHFIFDNSSRGFARLIRVRFLPEHNFLSIWW